MVRDLKPIMIRSDLSQLSLRKLVRIQDLMSVRQLERADVHLLAKLVKAQTHLQSGDNIPLGELPEHQAEISIHQVVYLLRAVDGGDVTQLRGDRCVEAHKPRDDATFSGQYLSSSAATGRLVEGREMWWL